MSDSDLTCFLKKGCSHSVQIKVPVYSLLYLYTQKYHLEQAGFYDSMLKFCQFTRLLKELPKHFKLKIRTN